jgi:hypothetical protein
MKAYDAWGSAVTYPHMAVAWSWAFDTPFKWTKQIAYFYSTCKLTPSKPKATAFELDTPRQIVSEWRKARFSPSLVVQVPYNPGAPIVSALG